MSPKAPQTKPTTPGTTATTPAPTTDVTPEMALTALEKAIQESPGGMWAKGARVNAMRIAGQRIANSLGELQAARARVAELESAMAPLINDALDAISGKGAPLKPSGATPASQQGTTSDKPANS